jgi:glyoxylase-like metal-dependent hydrolase (beta-lactamase superfamily II)
MATESSPAESSPAEPQTRPPQLVLDPSQCDRLYAFPPNRESLGGTSYWLQHPAGNLLIDCPSWPGSLEFLADRGVRWLVLTHRTAHARVLAIQQALGCDVVIQEQEAYLLPDVRRTIFADRLVLATDAQGQPELEVIWTCGYSPGSACLYWAEQGGLLFTGRHLLPTIAGDLAPLRTAKTFHWFRQLRSVRALIDRFRPDSPEPLAHICPGGSIGFLRGRLTIDRAAERLASLDLEALRSAPAGKI